MNILYKLATRSRPQRFAETIKSIVDNSSNDNYLVLVSIDEDDELMQAYIEDHTLGMGFPHYNVVVVNGRSKNKIDAINRDMEDSFNRWLNWDILVNISDDMVITSPNFDKVLRTVFAQTTDLFLHLPDGYANERLCTMSIMGKDYYNRFGYIYHPSYESVYCDNEATDVAKNLGKYLYVNEHLFKHNHPANVGAHLMDAQYERTEAKEVHAKDCQNYQVRKAMNFI